MARRLHLATLLLLTTTGRALAAPALQVAAACATTCVVPGGAVTVPIAFTAGGAAVGSIDFTLLHDPDLRFSAAARGAALPAVDWVAPLTPPTVVPGRLPVQIAPQFRLPLPAAPDGELALLTFTADAAAPEGCRSLSFAPDAPVFSDNQLGARVPGAPATPGGLTVARTCVAPPTTVTTTSTTTSSTLAAAEVCANCADDDADGLLDLADPDCGAAPLAVTRVVVVPGRRPTAPRTLTAKLTVPAAVPRVTLPVRVALTTGATSLLPCGDELAPSRFKKRRGKRTLVATRRTASGVTKVVLAPAKSGGTTVTLTARGLTTALAGTPVVLTLHLEGAAYAATPTLRPQGKKEVFP